MAEGEQATAVATDPGSGTAPAQAAASVQTPPIAGGGAGQQPQTAQEMASIAASELASLRANAGRFQQIQSRGDLDFMQGLQSKGLTTREIRETLDYLGQDLPEGMSVGDILTAIRTPTAATPPPGQQRGADDENRAMTVAEYRQLQKEQTEASQRQTEQTQEQEANAAAAKAATDYWAGFAKELKVEVGAQARSLRGITEAAEQQAIAEDIQKTNPYLSPEAALQQASEYIPTKEQLARASEIAKNDWKDLGNEIVSRAADGQLGYPFGTIAGGPGGAQTPPGAAGPLTREQQDATVLQAIQRHTAAAGYKPPAS